MYNLSHNRFKMKYYWCCQSILKNKLYSQFHYTPGIIWEMCESKGEWPEGELEYFSCSSFGEWYGKAGVTKDGLERSWLFILVSSSLQLDPQMGMLVIEELNGSSAQIKDWSWYICLQNRN